MCVEVILDLADADVDVADADVDVADADVDAADAAINEYEISMVHIARHFHPRKKFACLRIVDVGNSVAKLRRHYQHGGYIARGWMAISNRGEISQPTTLRTFPNHSHG